MTDYLQSLQRALGQPADDHLDDDKMAEIATAEIAGVDVEVVFAADVQHMESCVECADAYSELMEWMLAARGAMATAAAAVTPLDVYTTLLQREVERQLGSVMEWLTLLRNVARTLPGRFAVPPQADDLAAIDNIFLAEHGGSPAAPSAVLEAVRLAIGRNLSALTAYLLGTAEHAWGRTLDAVPTPIPRGARVRLQPGSVPAIPVAGSGGPQATATRWPLLDRAVGQPPIYFSGHAERLSELACRLIVRVDRPGWRNPSGRKVIIRYQEFEQAAVTDETGTAIFESIPISAVETLDITVETG